MGYYINDYIALTFSGAGKRFLFNGEWNVVPGLGVHDVSYGSHCSLKERQKEFYMILMNSASNSQCL